MLFVFLAYLVYLPVHTVIDEHCLPGASEPVVSVSLSDGHAPGAAAPSKHVHHEHSDGTTHHQHHTTDQDEVEFRGKIGSLKLVFSMLNQFSLELSDVADSVVVPSDQDELSPPSFSPGHWLISRGPPLA